MPVASTTRRILSADLPAARVFRDRAIRLVGSDPPSVLIGLTLLTLAGVLLRLAALDQPVRQDEATTILDFVLVPVRWTISDYTVPNNHIFHSVLAKLSVEIFGDALWAARLPAFTAGAILIPATYVLGRTLYGAIAGLYGAAVVASSGVLILYSTNARGYTIVLCCFVILVCIAARLHERESTTGWVSFAAVAALGFWTNPAMLYPFGGVVLWYVLLGRSGFHLDWRRVIRALGASGFTALIVLALYLPVIKRRGIRAIVANEYVSPGTFATLLENLPSFIAAVWRSWTTGIPPVAAYGLTLSLAVPLLLQARIGRHPTSVLLVISAWTAFLILLTQRIPSVRILMFLLPLFLVAAGAGLQLGIRAVVRRLRIPPATVEVGLALVLAIMLGASVISSGAVMRNRETGGFPDAERVAAELERHWRPGDAVTGMWRAAATVRYYFYTKGIRLAILSQGVPPGRRLFVVVDLKAGETVAGILANRKVAMDSLIVPIPIRRFDSSVLYVLEARDPVACGARPDGYGYRCRPGSRLTNGSRSN